MADELIFKSASFQEASKSNFTTNAYGKELNVDIPKDFGGPGKFFSPEDLYLASVVNCFIATFNVVASKSKFDFDALETKNELKLKKDDSGKYFCDKVSIWLSVDCKDKFKLEKIVDLTKKSCIIHSSIKTRVEVIIV
ncbi:MAG: OsmC family protein [Candidatus Woesearchaeota archaeon]